ncbi:uncharacterized protein LOC116340290 [Contarinia nasturtii]|uniref:uncharacterized protein LOC116340290 n=1 Tax=Contarinia nasturtii TaxID=265458 RepID=UPI0012D382DC|nr:uncharacterized protein LOC116340290 [Contarinia nasturtii]XP_031622574.1 uncharacterized protein LOC116340290 [Contarinia nasturtii]
MSDPIKLAFRQAFPIHVAVFVVLTCWFSLAEYAFAEITDHTKLFPEQHEVEKLVREWAPLVWLAPNEKFMPGDVTDFLQHVHAEKAKKSKNAHANNNNHNNNHIAYDQQFQSDDGDDEQLYYYETANELNVILSQQDRHPWERRHKRMYKDNYLFNYIIDLPIGDHSSNWFLVTNDNIDDLLTDQTSFIYGQSPSTGNVPIYAMVTLCNSQPLENEPDDIQSNLIDSKIGRHQATYIPVSNSLLKHTFTQTKIQSAVPRPVSISKRFGAPDDKNVTLNATRHKRESQETLTTISTSTSSTITNATGTATITTIITQLDEVTKATESSTMQTMSNESSNETVELNENYDSNETVKSTDLPIKSSSYPSFHVTYWMFYPYSQGKSICTLSLGPFGNLPIPQIFGVCLGTKKDFGSHVGDWEHMTLYFNGRKEPDQMYVSAHDAGAYYQYERLTGTFDFRRQETRKGILQHPNFPRTVVTSKNHPVLFSAQGSHGLWTAPGKHRFVRVARLFDINGFGTAWPTWKQVEISFDSERTGRSIGPEWLRFFGRWGNPKSRCHPLKKLGLNFCEFSDGPTGIPLKKPHFFCRK